MTFDSSYVLGILCIIFIMLVHWVADFVLQTHEQAMNKSSSNVWLLKHVGVYSLVMFIVFGWRFALLNGVLHFVTDYFTSRAVKARFDKKDFHNGFVIIGLDQVIHLSCLLLSLPLVGPWFS